MITLNELSILEIANEHVTSFSLLFFDTRTFQKIHKRKRIQKKYTPLKFKKVAPTKGLIRETISRLLIMGMTPLCAHK